MEIPPQSEIARVDTRNERVLVQSRNKAPGEGGRKGGKKETDILGEFGLQRLALQITGQRVVRLDVIFHGCVGTG